MTLSVTTFCIERSCAECSVSFVAILNVRFSYTMDKLLLTGRALGRVLNFLSGCMHTIKHLLPSVAKKPNLELKTRPKQLLGSLPLVIALPGYTERHGAVLYILYIIINLIQSYYASMSGAPSNQYLKLKARSILKSDM